MIGPREPGDLDACAALLAAVHAADHYPATWPREPARWLVPGELLAAWVARRPGELLGHVCLCSAEPGASAGVWSAATGRPAGALGVVSRLFVSPAARRAGLGRRLVQVAGDEARRRGLHPVLELLEMPEHDGAATALYERLGWRRTGAIPGLRHYVAPALPWPLVDGDLTGAERDLVQAAREVGAHAYVPASGFAVGCAVLTGSGRTYTGCNVENASYGLTICAERAAIATAVAAEGPRVRIAAVAVHADAASCSPCGACRQVIAELGPHAVVVYRREGRPVRRTIAELLPDAFTFPS